MRLAFLIVITSVLVISCADNKAPELPIYGHRDAMPDGDTLYHTIEPFYFTNQDGETISQEHTMGKIHVVDYFFSHCPTMCPTMTSQMKRVRNAHPDLLILTHTCDPERDSVEQLKKYAAKHEIDTENWHFLTGTKKSLYEQGVHSYMVSTQEDVLAPGGFLHSPMFILVDKDSRVRGMYDGRDTEEVNQLIEDITTLSESYE